MDAPHLPSGWLFGVVGSSCEWLLHVLPLAADRWAERDHAMAGLTRSETRFNQRRKMSLP